MKLIYNLLGRTSTVNITVLTLGSLAGVPAPTLRHLLGLLAPLGQGVEHHTLGATKLVGFLNKKSQVIKLFLKHIKNDAI